MHHRGRERQGGEWSVRMDIICTTYVGAGYVVLQRIL